MDRVAVVSGARSLRDGSVVEFRREVQSWLSATIPREWRERRGEMTYDEVFEIRRNWDRELYKAGFAGLSWPTKYGGRGLGPIEEYVFNEECAIGHAPEGLGRVGRLLAGPGIVHHGSPEQRDRFLPSMLRGDEIWCQGYSEPDAGSDLTSLRTRAVRDGEHYVLDGQKVWTSFAQYSDWCILLARTGEPGSGSRGLSLLLVPMRQEGISVHPLQQISGGEEFNEVFFEAARTETRWLLGAENEGWRVANDILTHERGVGFGALALANLDDYLQILHRHCSAGRPALGEAVRTFHTKVELLRWQMLRNVELVALGRDASRTGTILKLYWSELTQDVVHAGAMSGCAEHGAYWRQKLLEVRASSIASGTSEILRNVVAERVLGLPREPRGK